MGGRRRILAGRDARPGLPPTPAQALRRFRSAVGSGPAGFEHGGPWASAVPSAALAAALEGAAGPADRYGGANIDALVGIARQWAAVESWAAAGKLAALRAMTREDGDGTPRLRRRPDLPDGWDDSLTYEISGALAMGPVSAGNLASLAWALGTRLAGTGRLLADGTLTVPKARLIMQLFQPLDDGEAARAEALILGDLDGKTYFQVERLAWRAALAVAPDVAERRRSAAEKQARVTAFREESGAVGLSGRDLPAAEALAGHANVVARADLYQASGAFAGQSAGSLQALAYLHLLNGVSAREAITFAASAAPEPPGTSGPDNADGDDDGTGPDDGGGCPGPSRGPRPDDGRGPVAQPSGGPAPDPSRPDDHPAPPAKTTAASASQPKEQTSQTKPMATRKTRGHRPCRWPR